MSHHYHSNHSDNDDDESSNSLIAEINRRESQRKLTNYLSEDIKQSQQTSEAQQKINPNHQSHAGFSTANDFFRPQSKQRPQEHKRKSSDQKTQSKPQSQSTVTLSNPNIKFNDAILNKQLQKPILKDIEDLGKELKNNCNGCEQKKPTGGLNYKQRNKRLIQEHNKRINSEKKSTQNQTPFKTPDKRQTQKGKTQAQDFRQSLNQFQYSENKNDAPQNLLLSEDRDAPGKPHKKYNFIIDNSKIPKQQKLKISNHTVYFPYQPYEAQINYMEKVIQSLDKKQNAILESPTGTGKTLCLLSAALSWVQNEFWRTYKEIPIIYLSRTHSQLTQVSKELQKTCFRPTMATFGSREIFCTKQNFKELKGREKVEACSKAVKLFLKYGRNQRDRQDRRHVGLRYDQPESQDNNDMNIPTSQKKLSQLPEADQRKIEETMCEYYRGQRYVLDLAREKFKNKILSNEKIKQLSKVHKFCPYYYPTFVKPICNLFLMPYNYLLDGQLNDKYKDIVKGSILIFDEAHNVPESSCEGRSFSINKRTFEDALKELTKLMKGQRMSNQLFMVLNDHQGELGIFETQIKHYLNNINSFIDDVDFPKNQTVTEEDATLKKLFNIHETEQKIYQFLYEKLNDAQKKVFMNMPNDESHNKMIQKMIRDIEKPILSLEQLCQDLAETPDGIFQNMQKVVGFVKSCLYLMNPQQKKGKWIDRQINHFRVVINKVDKNWEVNLVCLVPFLTMKEIEKMEPHNIILTSGTLSPIDTWESQLGVPFPIRFTNTHVISPNQLMLRIVTNKEKQTFNFSYKYLQQNFKTIYQTTLRAITELAQKIPNGMLVVTPSYKVMNSIEKCMQFNTDLRKRLNGAKKIFMESKDNFQDLIKKFRKAAVENKGALLFCVCRGKISEGIDFPNELCRSVIFIGIPFPNISDIALSEKKNHYDRIGQQESNYKFSGNKWYENLTFRSVNQAIGRVIRHINDYGSIFLLDIRYNMNGYKSQLPKWSQLSIETIELKAQTLDKLDDFYHEMRIKFDNYEGKNEVADDFEGDHYSQDEQSKQGKVDKPSQNIVETKGQNRVWKNEQKRVFPNMLKKPYKEQPEKKVEKNAFTAIMGTNQSRYQKKKSNFGSNPV